MNGSHHHTTTTPQEPSMTTTMGTPVVDQLFAFITHLTKAGRPELAEHVWIRPISGSLEIHVLDSEELAAFAATFTAPLVKARFVDDDAPWYVVMVVET